MNRTGIYLLLLGCASAVAPAAMAQEPSGVPQWHQSQRTMTSDPYTTYTFRRFNLVGRYADTRLQTADPPALAIDCVPAAGSDQSQGRYLAANLRAGSALKVIYVEPLEIHGYSYFPEVAVQYSTDSAGGTKDTWSMGSDKKSVSVPRRALKELLHARAVAIVAQDDHGRQLAMRFDMPDPTPVVNDCNLDLR